MHLNSLHGTRSSRDVIDVTHSHKFHLLRETIGRWFGFVVFLSELIKFTQLQSKTLFLYVFREENLKVSVEEKKKDFNAEKLDFSVHFSNFICVIVEHLTQSFH